MSIASTTTTSKFLTPEDIRKGDHPKEMLHSIGAILTELCRKNDLKACPVISKFHAAALPTISVLDYLLRISQYAECSDTCFLLAMVYIDRIQSHPDLVVNSLNIHRLLITSVLLAAKFFDDHYYNNAFYARIGGVSKEEMNQLELEFLFMIGFSLAITSDEYKRYDHELRAQYATRNGIVLTPSQDICHVKLDSVLFPATLLPFEAVSEPASPISTDSRSWEVSSPANSQLSAESTSSPALTMESDPVACFYPASPVAINVATVYAPAYPTTADLYSFTVPTTIATNPAAMPQAFLKYMSNPNFMDTDSLVHKVPFQPVYQHFLEIPQ